MDNDVCVIPLTLCIESKTPLSIAYEVRGPQAIHVRGIRIKIHGRENLFNCLGEREKGKTKGDVGSFLENELGKILKTDWENPSQLCLENHEKAAVKRAHHIIRHANRFGMS